MNTYEEQLRKKLIDDAARSLGVEVAKIPSDLSDKQLDKVFNTAPGTTSVKRSRGDLPIASYKYGRSRKTPFFAAIDYKLSQLVSTSIAA